MVYQYYLTHSQGVGYCSMKTALLLFFICIFSSASACLQWVGEGKGQVTMRYSTFHHKVISIIIYHVDVHAQYCRLHCMKQINTNETGKGIYYHNIIMVPISGCISNKQTFTWLLKPRRREIMPVDILMNLAIL
jgi:hypothetical protein